MIEADLDVDVAVRWFFHGGSTSALVLNRIRSDNALCGIGREPGRRSVAP